MKKTSLNTVLNSKIIFFDIDGTLVDFNAKILDSTIKALELAQQNGHKLMICTGRSFGQLHKELLQIPFDGYVCAAGAYVRYGNQVISSSTLSKDLLNQIIQLFEEEHMVYALQCVDHMATQKDIYAPLIETLKTKLHVNEKQLPSVLYGMQLLDNSKEFSSVEKALFYESNLTIDDVKKRLGNGFDVVDMSFMESTRTSGEITRAGINKAYGMQKLLEYLGKQRSDSVAFGDGTNDIEMLEYAGIGIAMGNAPDEVKQHADKITANIEDDGIFKMLHELELI